MRKSNLFSYSMLALGLLACEVSSGNLAPVVVEDTLVGVEDEELVIAASALLENDSDDGQVSSLRITAVSAAENGTVSLEGDELVFRPNENYHGPASFRYTASDGELTAEALVTITISAVNDAPVAVNDGNSKAFVGAEDSTLSIAASALLANDSDVDGDTLSVVGVSGAVNGSVSLAAEVISFVPVPGHTGEASFVYTLSDGVVEASATVQLEITAENDAPVAVDDVAVTAEDTELRIATTQLLANDSDADGDSLSLVSVSNEVNGSVSVVGEEVVFVPLAEFHGTASFEYTVSDGTANDVGVVSISVTAENDAPTANAQSLTTNEDTALNVVLTGNDIDGDILSFVVVSQPSNGTLSGTAPNLVYTPNANFNGTDSFTFKANDGTVDSSAATIDITITAENDAPVAVDDDLRVSAGGVLLFSGNTHEFLFSSLLSNDSDVDSPSQDLAILAASSNNASVSLGADRLLVTPSALFSGVGEVVYTLSDGLATDTALVLFDVVTPVCGDGLLNQVSEECDDGNNSDEDGCSASCAEEFCGDGVIQNGLGEECDDANAVDTDTCRNSCQTPKVVQVVTGDSHTCALSDEGAVRCWGAGTSGQLGYGNQNNIGDNETPASAGDVNVGGTVIQITAGSEHTCALLSTGNVRCWGASNSGQLGYGNVNNIGDNETPASAGDVNVGATVTQIAAGGLHTCALLSTGNVRCWGDGNSGRLGYGNVNNIGDNETPASAGDVNVGATVTQIVAGTFHTCALLSTGNVRCWGFGNSGRLGYGNVNNIGDNESPASAGDVNVGATVAQIAVGSAHTCALLSTGNVRCWGNGVGGRLGYGNVNNIGDNETPASAGDVNVGGTVTQIDAGNGHTCALLSTGNVRCWGNGVGGQLGYGNVNTIGDNETPASAGDVNVGGTVTQITVGDFHTCALLSTGNVRCWGFGRNGQLGYGDIVTAVGDDEVPAVFAPVVFAETIIQVANGTTHSCALSNLGTVRCWGFGDNGRLGYGNTTSLGDDDDITALPLVNVGGTVTKIAAGSLHTCALLSTGDVRCWGFGANGRLGYGNLNTIGDDETPASAGNVNVGGTVTEITAGTDHTCALLSTGNVRCWGNGVAGRLGYGNVNTIGDNETPASAGDVNVGGTVTEIAAGGEHTCALLSTGNVRCWGDGNSGRLGYGNQNTIGDNETPASAGNVNVGATVTEITAGTDHTCALLSTGNVRCWGNGVAGQLGYGNVNNIGDNETPASAGDVNVGGTVTQITVGDFHTCALLSTGNVRCWGFGVGGRPGYGNQNNIGDNETPASAGDVNVGGTVTQIDASNGHTCSLLGGGSMKCWGINTDGCLGYGNLNILFGDDEVPADLGIVSIFE